MEKYGIIYLIKNKLNGKIYVGQTTEEKGFNGRYERSGIGIERVYKYHKCNKDNNKSHNSHLLRSIEKYGFDSFEVIEEFDVAFNREELDKLESLYIDIYQTRNKAYGYNDKGGGSHGKLSKETKKKLSEKAKLRTGENNSFYGKHHSEETKQKIREANSGKHLTEEHKQKLREANKGKCHTDETKKKIGEANYGKKHPFHNRHHSEETKQKMSKSHKGKHHSEETKKNMGKKIICITTNKVFDTIKESMDFYRVDKSSICECCKGKRKSAGKLKDGTKLQWMNYEEYLKQQNKDNTEVA